MNVQSDNPEGFGRSETSGPIVPKSAVEALRPQLGTPPPSRSRQARNRWVVFFNFVVSAIFLAALGAGAAVYLGKRAFDGPGPLAHSDTVLVRPGSGLVDIANLLERNGMISDARIFRIGVQIHGKGDQLKAGEYEIRARASMHEIMDLLESGRSVLYSLTIPEGLTVEQAVARIAEHEALVGDLPEQMPSEGWLATDTQRFTRGTTRAEIIDKMVAEQTRLVESIWEKRADDLPIETIEEFVTLASIVEKETGRADERPRVAAVFINRLRKGMRLQSDPTIIYGLFGGKGKPADRPIYRSDITKPTPYNTYVIDALPPAPIANPGRAALEAVANPSTTDELYFVADGLGGHVFAATLDEHNENVQRWRALEASRKSEAEQEPVPAAIETEAGAATEQ